MAADCTQRSSKFWNLAISIDNLGWDCFIEGQIPFSLINVIKPMLRRYKPRGSIELWGCKFIKGLIGLTHKQWLYRNNKVHYVNGGLMMKQHKELTAKIKILLKTRHCALLHRHRHYLLTNFEVLGSGPTLARQVWITLNMEMAISVARVAKANFCSQDTLSIEHSIRRPKYTTTPHSPFHLLQHSVSSARDPISTNHTRITQMPQSPQPIAVFTS